MYMKNEYANVFTWHAELLSKFLAFIFETSESRKNFPRTALMDTIDEIDEAKALGATSILLQGGHHPDLKIDYYEELFNFISKHN